MPIEHHPSDIDIMMDVDPAMTCSDCHRGGGMSLPMKLQTCAAVSEHASDTVGLL